MSDIYEILEEIATILTEEGARISSAESCTGGLIGKYFTDRAGSSVYYESGIISYSNEVKERVLGVPGDILRMRGAVSEETARAMAEGVKALMRTEYGVATTGIAGPGGATETKPVGLVYIGVSGPTETKVYEEHFAGSRADVREATAAAALRYVKEMLA